MDTEGVEPLVEVGRLKVQAPWDTVVAAQPSAGAVTGVPICVVQRAKPLMTS